MGTIAQTGAVLGVAAVCAAVGIARASYYRHLRPTLPFPRKASPRRLGDDEREQGTRVTTLAYDAAGFLHSVLDPAQHTSVFAYDLAGRPTSETLPDQSVIGMSYDSGRNQRVAHLRRIPGRADVHGDREQHHGLLGQLRHARRLGAHRQ